MTHDELQGLARTVADLPPDEERAVADAVAAIRDARARQKEARIADLRALSDIEAVEAAFEANQVMNSWPPEPALQVLRDAGFTREKPKRRISFVFPGGHSIELFGTREDLGCVKAHLCDAVPGIKYSKGA